jgi:zinc D-Ala-D-Ala carboxypeptidase
MRGLFLAAAALLAVFALRRPASIGQVTSGQASPHFSWDELTTTGTGLANDPNSSQRMNLERLAFNVLEPVRDQFGPIRITSAFRSSAVNHAVEGATSSSHLDGRGVDLYATQGATAAQIATWLYGRTSIPLRQIIVESHTGHLHLEMQKDGPPYLRQFLQTQDGRSYFPWTPSTVT